MLRYEKFENTSSIYFILFYFISSLFYHTHSISRSSFCYYLLILRDNLKIPTYVCHEETFHLVEIQSTCCLYLQNGVEFLNYFLNDRNILTCSCVKLVTSAYLQIAKKYYLSISGYDMKLKLTLGLHFHR